MSNYPVMLSIKGLPVLIIGGGNIASRKVPPLLQNGAVVTVISPDLSPKLHKSAQAGLIRWKAGIYQSGMIADYKPVLVFAATNNAGINQEIAEEARQQRCWVNVADDAGSGNFFNPVFIDCDPVQIIISTNGTSPALARHLKDKIETVIDPAYSIIAAWLAEVRPFLKQTVELQEERQVIYQAILNSDIIGLIRQGDSTLARHYFDQFVAGKNV